MDFAAPARHCDLALAAMVNLNNPIEFVTKAYRLYWEEAADLNDAAVIAGLVGDELDLGELHVEAMLTESTELAHDRGVVDAPGFVIQGQAFVGREHLPWIAELLQTAA